MRTIPIFFLLGLLAGSPTPAAAQSPQLDHFESKIRPVLVEQCEVCHSAALEKPMGGLRLDSREALRQGGASGAAVIPGQPGQSLLLKALTYKDANLKMPPTGKLPDNVIADFEKWIADGAEDPRSTEAEESTGGISTKKQEGPGTPIEEGRKWWAFQPLTEHAAPKTSKPDWVARKIDSFVLAKLDESNLEPSPAADPRTLIRRAYFDLIGLPPTYEQVEAFAADPSPEAYAALIDVLLDSPRYGERWGRHWLDVARWAEDHPTSESTNGPHPYAWRYRDWVIEALNDDIPYDRFIRMQFAADLLPGFEPADMRALGYIGNSPMYHKDPRLSRDVIETLTSDDWDERVDAVSRGLLGLTVACARCHDHKFDPITNKDYHAVAGVFASTWLVKRPIVAMDPAAADKLVWDHERLYRVKGMLGNIKELDTIAPELHPKVAEMDAEMKELEAKLAKDSTPLTHAVVDCGVWIDGSIPTVTWFDLRPGQPRDLPIFIRGNVANPGEIVPRRFLTVFAEDEPEPFRQGSGRLELADKIVGTAGPLAARVWVNRVWGWHFGQHIAGTPSDFGTQGERPTHPELLDDLAARFVENGWSLKWLHREIMLSATYRQDSRHLENAAKTDPTNRWLWRYAPSRLDIESWRDAVLQVSDELELRVGGPSEPVDTECEARRTVYSQMSRGRPHAIFQLYDYPDTTQHAPQRQITTTPLQQLFVLNSEWMEYQARSLAQRVYQIRDAGEKITALYRRALLRDPTAEEVDQALSFLAAREATVGHIPWPEYTQILLSTNEFIYLH
ncbi:MAG: PSD1 and planctomycete cytochrome C domain-containing protein [Acidobacteria bacterium]|nr:PSD1 and planctomycete cytochrome C domain-containing protein [Acidobacteriota bacterium]